MEERKGMRAGELIVPRRREFKVAEEVERGIHSSLNDVVFGCDEITTTSRASHDSDDR